MIIFSARDVKSNSLRRVLRPIKEIVFFAFALERIRPRHSSQITGLAKFEDKTFRNCKIKIRNCTELMETRATKQN